MDEKFVQPPVVELTPIVNKPLDTTRVPISLELAHCIDEITNTDEMKSKKATPIHVDEIASRIAKFYELARKVIDWKEDTVLRRSAIERIIKRLIFSHITKVTLTHSTSPTSLAEIVTLDLIRGGHLPNDSVPRELVPTVAQSLRKYLYFLEHTTFSSNDPLILKEKINFYTYIIEIASCEIEEILTVPVKENSLIASMAHMVNKRVKIIPENSMSADEKYTQIYIAVCRTLYDLDDGFISYQLLKSQFPNWSNPTDEELVHLQEHILSIKQQIDTVLAHPLGKDFNAVCERIDTVFTLVGDYIDEYRPSPDTLKTIITQKSIFLERVGAYYDKRYKTLKTRLMRLGIFSTLSVFLSNSFTFFLIEVPLASVFYEGFNIFTTIIDFVVPTTIMFLLVSIIRPPPAANKDKVLETMSQYVYEPEHIDFMEIYPNKKRHRVIMFIVGVLYITMTLFVFWAVASIFYYTRLPITSVVFDTFTIALTVFAAVMIRNKSKELSVDDKTHVWEFLLDMISVPIAKIGSFFAAKWKEYNVVAIFFNFVVETPFAILLDFIEGWSQFLKERRAELH